MYANSLKKKSGNLLIGNERSTLKLSLLDWTGWSQWLGF